MADRKALCLVSGGLEEISAADRLILPGDPLFDLHAASKQYVDQGLNLKEPADPNRLATGEATYRRGDVIAANVTSNTQLLRLVYLTSQKSFTTTQVRVLGGAAAAAATPTRCEIGLFEINAAGDGTRVALIENDTSLFAASNSTYTRSWLASYNVVAGQRYALSWLVVTAVAAPTYSGVLLTVPMDVEAAFPLRVTGRLNNQTTTPASFTAASVIGSNTRPYGVILP